MLLYYGEECLLSLHRSLWPSERPSLIAKRYETVPVVIIPNAYHFKELKTACKGIEEAITCGICYTIATQAFRSELL